MNQERKKEMNPLHINPQMLNYELPKVKTLYPIKLLQKSTVKIECWILDANKMETSI